MIMGHIEYPPDIRLPIYFSTETGMFTCVYAGTTYEYESIRVLKERVLDIIQYSLALEWRAVIILKTYHHEYIEDRTYLFLEKERVHVTHHHSLGYRQADWYTPEENRFQQSQAFSWPKDEPLLLPVAPQKEEQGDIRSTLYLPYDEQTWGQIEEIQNYLVLCNKILKKALYNSGVSATLALCQTLYGWYQQISQADSTRTKLQTQGGTQL